MSGNTDMATGGSCCTSSDNCVTCTSKHNRTRFALCQCKHCSESFCFDCMKDHNDSLQDSIAQVSNQYNEAQALLKAKKELIVDETIKSKQQIQDWLKKCTDELNAQIDIEEQETKVV